MNKDDEIEFDEKLSQERHKELTNLLSRLITSLNQKDNADISVALEKNTSSIMLFAQAIANLPEPKVSIEFNSLKDSLAALLESQKEIISELKIMNLPKKWVFNVMKRAGYNEDGLIRTVEASQEFTKIKA